MNEIPRITPAAKDDEAVRERGADAVPAWLEQKRTQRAETAAGGRRFRLDRFSEFTANSPRWLIRGLLEADCLAMIFADPAAGKSFLAITGWADGVGHGRSAILRWARGLPRLRRPDLDSVQTHHIR